MVPGSGFGGRETGAAPAPPWSFSFSAALVAAGAAVSAHAVCVVMSAPMTQEISHEPQASTFALHGPLFAGRAILLPRPARQRPMKSPLMSMFPRARLTRRVLRAINTMRMAKSWGHSGSPVPARHGRKSRRVAPRIERASGPSEQCENYGDSARKHCHRHEDVIISPLRVLLQPEDPLRRLYAPCSGLPYPSGIARPAC